VPAPKLKRPQLWSDPEWEAAKAARRNLGHAEAIQESFSLQKQFRWQWRSNMPASPVELNQVLRTLTQKRIPFVLTGANAIGGWTGRPRSTHDVDILVKSGRNHARAVKALRELYPELEVHTLGARTAFFVPGEKESVIDVVYPMRADIAETLAHPVWLDDKANNLRYRIPSREAILANKYGAMLSTGRRVAKRMQDAVDFTQMVDHAADEGQQPLDLARLRALGEMVWPGGGGDEILGLVEQVQRGLALDLNGLIKLP